MAAGAENGNSSGKKIGKNGNKEGNYLIDLSNLHKKERRPVSMPVLALKIKFITITPYYFGKEKEGKAEKAQQVVKIKQKF